jgi:MFS superfamily sulfate permease-like transporter
LQQQLFNKKKFIHMNNFKNNLKHDLPASIIVFLVAVPLCLGIALASGAPLFSGIIAGIVGGIVVGSLSGSPLGVSGPAAGLAVIVLAAIEDLGAFESFLLAVVIAGAIQLLLGFLRAGIIGYYFPSSVIKGMLTGIGLIIILKQIPHAFGYDADPEGSLAFQQPDGHNTFSELYYMLDFISPGALVVTSLSLLILILWEQPFMKRIRLFQLVQGPLVVVVLGVLLNMFFQNFPTFTISKEHLVQLPTFSNFTGFIGNFTFPDFSQFGNPQIYTVAITMAVVASLETLLSVEAIDKLDPYKRVTPTNRELKAQGIGNMLSGLIGGLPVTQVIVRSSANIQSGGRTKTSAIAHGILMLSCVVAIPHVLNMIPLASLAAILFLVGYKLAKPKLFIDMYQKGWIQFVPFVVTVLGIMFTDLLYGIGMGLIVAIMNILYDNYKTPYFFDKSKYHKGDEVNIALSEDVTFINKAAIMKAFKQIPNGAKVVIDASKNVHMDEDIWEIIEDFKRSTKYRDIDLKLEGFSNNEESQHHAKLLRDSLNGSKQENEVKKDSNVA